ncbi:uncharacterized protein [Choristoneura fumiferana]|uniref:uncharacterized protein n=1 Tax=Choristoneura fumiferana TaxID=7141 RepID=UPI003D1575BA
MSCLACNKSTDASSLLKCVRCNGNYHCYCVNLTLAQITENLRQKWVCPYCEPIGLRRRRNDDTPIERRPESSVFDDSVMSCDGVLDESRVMQGASIDPKNNTVLVTPPNSYSMSSQSRPSLATCPEALLNDIVLKLTTLQTQFSAIQGIRTDLSQVKSDIAEMRSSIDSKLDSLAGRMNAIESRVGVLEESKMELDEVKKAINGVIIDTRRNEQWARRSNIQINGVPETRGENLVSIVKTLAALSGFELNTSTDVDFVTRVAVRNDTDSAKPKPIVLKMQARYKKDDFISALRKLKNLKASDIGFANCSNRIYINDHLSAFNKYLLREAKRRANQKQYQFCWVRNCTIMVRRNENSPILYITSEEALNKIS